MKIQQQIQLIKKESENTDEVITDDTNNLSKDENSDTNTNNTFN